MKIFIINGSPHTKGTSALLISEFMRGAKENGHTVEVFDAAKDTPHSCIACDRCRTTDKGCVFKDSMEKVNPLLLDADMVVFATPLYYFGMSSQIKAVIDRFYANNGKLREMNKKTMILATCGDAEDFTMDALKAHYKAVTNYLNWTSAGELYAFGMYTRADIEGSDYPAKAYELGKSIK